MIKTIEGNYETAIEVKKSKFICNAFYVETKEEAELKLEEIRTKYHDARHNCFAYRISLKDESIYEKCSDDGEPQGTAGAPMLEILKNNDLTNIILVVTRYFGGILLGTGGLVRAYTDSSKETLNLSQIVEKEIGNIYELQVNYDQQKKIDYLMKKYDIDLINVEYLEVLTYKLESTKENENKFLEELREYDNYKIIEEDKYVKVRDLE